MNTLQNDLDWESSIEDYNFTEEFEADIFDLANNDSDDFLYETEAANEDLWRMVDSMDGDWEVVAAEGLLVL